MFHTEGVLNAKGLRVPHTSLTSHAPGGWAGQNVGLRDFCHILTLLPPGASVFHKHMSSYNKTIQKSVQPADFILHTSYPDGEERNEDAHRFWG